MNEWNKNILNQFDLKETECILGVIESSKQKNLQITFPASSFYRLCKGPIILQ